MLHRITSYLQRIGNGVQITISVVLFIYVIEELAGLRLKPLASPSGQDHQCTPMHRRFRTRVVRLRECDVLFKNHVCVDTAESERTHASSPWQLTAFTIELGPPGL